jgi:hypothetical protein
MFVFSPLFNRILSCGRAPTSKQLKMETWPQKKISTDKYICPVPVTAGIGEMGPGGDTGIYDTWIPAT